MAPDYLFRSMTASDLPLVRRWLALPHVREWWGEPEEQYSLVSGDLDEPAMDQYIFSTAGNPFAYLQCYDLTAWNSGFGPHPPGTRGIDVLIGEPGMIGRGHGSALIRCFVDERLQKGAPRIVTDPDPANRRSAGGHGSAHLRRRNSRARSTASARR